MPYLQLKLLPFLALASQGWDTSGRGGGTEHLCHYFPSSSLPHPQPLGPGLLTPSGGSRRQPVSGAIAQSDVAGAGSVLVFPGTFVGFTEISPPGTLQL